MSVTLTQPQVMRLINDASFFSQFPEFRGMLNRQYETRTVKTGCCGTRRTSAANPVTDFVSVLESLRPDRLAALKQRMGTGDLLYFRRDQKTSRQETIRR